MSRGQLLQLGQSLADKRLATHGSSEGYEAVMFYVYLLQVCACYAPPPPLLNFL